MPLACTVRGCGLPLSRLERTFACARQHSYDIARSGYLNLLQPQDRRSRAAGDSRETVMARARLLSSAGGRFVLDALINRAATLQLVDVPSVVDLGSGSGDALGELARQRAITGIGVDLSTAAAEYAARRFPSLMWVVANADRRLPLLDRSVDLVLSMHARRNPIECARVLKARGLLLLAVPAHDDLIELRTLLHRTGVERSRAEGVLIEHEPYFKVSDRSLVRGRQQFCRAELLDLLKTTYRGARVSVAKRVAALEDTRVTVAAEFLILVREDH